MKYLKLFENFQNINSLCQIYCSQKYTINNEGIVDVDNYVQLSDRRLNKIPIKFGKVTGNFDCSYNYLSSLEGCPKEVGGYFSCFSNRLTSLVGGPEEVGGYFCFSKNKIKSLEGCPKEVGGSFDCLENSLSSLEGCPKDIIGYFNCLDNKLTSLKGCPKYVGRYFRCDGNQLSIIDYLPECIEGYINLMNNKIRNIKVEDINWKFFGKCNLGGNPIDSLFKYWEGDLKDFIRELEFEDFIRDDGRSVDILRFEYALNGKEYDEEEIKKNYNLIYKE